MKPTPLVFAPVFLGLLLARTAPNALSSTLISVALVALSVWAHDIANETDFA